MKATAEMIEQNRSVITQAREGQVFYVQYGENWTGLAQVKQVVRKQGNEGETSLLVRFMDCEKIMKLSWRDDNILAIKPLELEGIRAYLLLPQNDNSRA